MPTYEFFCKKCDKNFETVESITGYDGDGDCPTCGNNSKERILSARVHFIGASVESPSYNPAFGKVIKNKKEAKDLAKERGMIEIGNEKIDSVHKSFEKDRLERLKKGWDDV